MTASEKRRAAREAKKAADFRALNFHMIGSKHRNAGRGLTVGEEWETSDGFRVRQLSVMPNPNETGHFIGEIQVLGFAGRYAL